MSLTKPAEGLVGAAIAAEYLDRPVSWVHDNWRQLEMPAIRLGNRLAFRLSELDEWIEAHREVAVPRRQTNTVASAGRAVRR
jgi:hypothetical protein